MLIQPGNKDIQINSKIGLTDPEKMFFTKSQQRSCLQFNNKKIGVAFCREALDIKELTYDFFDMDLDFIIWLSYIKWEDFESPENEMLRNDYLGNALKLSKEFSVPFTISIQQTL